MNTRLIDSGTIVDSKDGVSLTRKGSVTFEELKEVIADEFNDRDEARFNRLVKTDAMVIAISHALATALELTAPFVLEHRHAQNVGVAISTKLTGDGVKFAVKLENRDEL